MAIIIIYDLKSNKKLASLQIKIPECLHFLTASGSDAYYKCTQTWKRFAQMAHLLHKHINNALLSLGNDLASVSTIKEHQCQLALLLHHNNHSLPNLFFL